MRPRTPINPCTRSVCTCSPASASGVGTITRTILETPPVRETIRCALTLPTANYENTLRHALIGRSRHARSDGGFPRKSSAHYTWTTCESLVTSVSSVGSYFQAASTFGRKNTSRQPRQEPRRGTSKPIIFSSTKEPPVLINSRSNIIPLSLLYEQPNTEYRQALRNIGLSQGVPVSVYDIDVHVHSRCTATRNYRPQNLPRHFYSADPLSNRRRPPRRRGPRVP